MDIDKVPGILDRPSFPRLEVGSKGCRNNYSACHLRRKTTWAVGNPYKRFTRLTSALFSNYHDTPKYLPGFELLPSPPGSR
jgi:hypothetical protein